MMRYTRTQLKTLVGENNWGKKGEHTFGLDSLIQDSERQGGQEVKCGGVKDHLLVYLIIYIN